MLGIKQKVYLVIEHKQNKLNNGYENINLRVWPNQKLYLNVQTKRVCPNLAKCVTDNS